MDVSAECLTRTLGVNCYLILYLDGGIGSLAYECSGGRQDEREECFDLRLMWRYRIISSPVGLVAQTLVDHITGRTVWANYTHISP